MKITRPLQTNY